MSFLAERSPRALALVLALGEQGLWPPHVPTVVLVECLPVREVPLSDEGARKSKAVLRCSRFIGLPTATGHENLSDCHDRSNCPLT